MSRASIRRRRWSLRHPLVMRRLARSDEGFALPAVIAIFAIVSITSLTLAGMAVHAVGFATATRASVQSRAAADSGINTVEATMENSAADLQQRLPCSASHSYNPGLTESDTVNYPVTYSATVQYYDASGAQLPCSGSFLPVPTGGTGDPPVKAVIDSTGTAQFKGAAGQSTGDTSTVTALASINVQTTYDNSAAINATVFSNGGYTIANGASMVDPAGGLNANIYSNGNVTCTTGGTSHVIQGSIYAQGSVELDNPCFVRGSVWTGTFTATGNTEIGQNLMLYNSPTFTLSGVAVDGSLVSNGNIEIANSIGSCSSASSSCGSVTSFGGAVTVDSGNSAAGDVQANGNVSVVAGKGTAVYGSVRSISGGVAMSGTGGTAHLIGGYVAAAGNQGVPLSQVGEPASTCGASGYVTLKPCPGTLTFDASQIPTQLDYPTNTSVVAPPKQSLPTIDSDTTSQNLWASAGWTVVNQTNCSLPADVSTNTTRRLVVVTGCSAPLAMSGMSISGDLAIMSQSGFAWAKNASIASGGGTTPHTFEAIVPTDALLPAPSTTPIVTWSYPGGEDANGNGYHTPTCAASPSPRPSGYGDIVAQRLTTTSDIHSFFYTPCSFNVANNSALYGEIYIGNMATTGNAPSMTYYPVGVPGALINPTGPGVATTTITTAETSRFDARS